MSKLSKRNIRKNINKEHGFVSKTLLIIVILMLLLDAIVLENMMINKIKGITPVIIDSVISLSEENLDSNSNPKDENDKNENHVKEVSSINEEYDKEDIRYTKNCEEIVKEMGMGDRLIRENNKKMNIRYHQTNGVDLMITIGKNGSCTIKEGTE